LLQSRFQRTSCFLREPCGRVPKRRRAWSRAVAAAGSGWIAAIVAMMALAGATCLRPIAQRAPAVSTLVRRVRIVVVAVRLQFPRRAPFRPPQRAQAGRVVHGRLVTGIAASRAAPGRARVTRMGLCFLAMRTRGRSCMMPTSLPLAVVAHRSPALTTSPSSSQIRWPWASRRSRSAAVMASLATTTAGSAMSFSSSTSVIPLRCGAGRILLSSARELSSRSRTLVMT